MKKCSRCLQRKDLSDFGMDTRLADGRKHHCKKCEAEKQAIRKALKQAGGSQYFDVDAFAKEMLLPDPVVRFEYQRGQYQKRKQKAA